MTMTAIIKLISTVTYSTIQINFTKEKNILKLDMKENVGSPKYIIVNRENPKKFSPDNQN